MYTWSLIVIIRVSTLFQFHVYGKICFIFISINISHGCVLIWEIKLKRKHLKIRIITWRK